MTGETSSAGILRYYDLPFSACGARSDGPAGTFYCEMARGHAGDHGCGPYVEWTVMWPTKEDGE